eukprot:6822364-Alexandrium_andersonii.AAC.1
MAECPIAASPTWTAKLTWSSAYWSSTVLLPPCPLDASAARVVRDPHQGALREGRPSANADWAAANI